MLDDRISAEFLGLARQRRAVYTAAGKSTGAATQSILAALEKCYDRRTTAIPYRRLEAARDAWAAIPRDTCLSQSISLTRRVLQIEDIRVVGCTVSSPDWGDAKEPGLVIVRHLVTAGPRRMVKSAPLVAGVILHAIGRWYQRAFGTDPTALHADLQTLAAAAPGLIAAGVARVAVDTGRGGQWVGGLGTDGEKHIHIDVRTFH